MAAVLAATTPALADPKLSYVRAPSTQMMEVAAHTTPTHVRISLRLTTTVTKESDVVDDPTKWPEGPTLMEQLRDRILEELPVVSTAVVAPLPISSPHGTLAGVGVLGKF
jgi:hypothetical protein